MGRERVTLGQMVLEFPALLLQPRRGWDDGIKDIGALVQERWKQRDGHKAWPGKTHLPIRPNTQER